jgi:phage-related protein
MKPKVLLAEFGDGFAQRAQDGINSNPLRRQFSWSTLTKEEADYIDGFLTEARGVNSFYYQLLDETQPRLYVCPEWEVETVAFDIYNITATFVEVFDIEA